MDKQGNFANEDFDKLNNKINEAVEYIRKMRFVSEEEQNRPKEPYKAFKNIKNGFVYEKDFLLAIAYFFYQKRDFEKVTILRFIMAKFYNKYLKFVYNKSIEKEDYEWAGFLYSYMGVIL